MTVDDGNTFVNIGADYPDPERFTIVAWGDVPEDENEYLDSEVCVTGEVEMYEDVPQIQVLYLHAIVKGDDGGTTDDDGDYPGDDIPGPY